MKGSIVAVEVSVFGTAPVVLDADCSIWTVGMDGKDARFIELPDLPALVYSREPCWLHWRDEPDDAEGWKKDPDLEWDSCASGVWIPWVSRIDVLYREGE